MAFTKSTILILIIVMIAVLSSFMTDASPKTQKPAEKAFPQLFDALENLANGLFRIFSRIFTGKSTWEILIEFFSIFVIIYSLYLNNCAMCEISCKSKLLKFHVSIFIIILNQHSHFIMPMYLTHVLIQQLRQ